MEKYNLRLIKIGVAIILAFVLLLGIIRPLFYVEPSNEFYITSTDELKFKNTIMRSRSSKIITDTEFSEQGYNTDLPEGYAEVLSDDKSVLYFNKSNGAIAIKSINDNCIWLSNPADLSQEVILQGSERERLKSQIKVTYYDAQGRYGEMDTQNDCVAYGNMQYEVKNDSLSVSYRLGKDVVTLADVPQQISKTRFDKFIAMLSVEDKEYLLEQYGIASAKGASGDFKKKLETKYPNIAKDDIYYLKYDSSRILAKVKSCFDKCGYTIEELKYDNEENGIEVEVSESIYFEFELIYSLRDGALSVTLDGEKMSYNPSCPPNTVSVLEYFGAADINDIGYIFVPDGSGSIIYLNNGKQNESVFSMPVFGADTSSNTESAYVDNNKASLPVFGMKKGAVGFLATIDAGDALANINACVSGQKNSFNCAFASFRLTDYDTLELSEDSVQIYHEKAPYRNDFTVTYYPLNEDKSNYTDMAKKYSEILLEKGILSDSNSDKEYSLLVDFICGVPVTKNILGITANTLEVMTSYSDIKNISNEFLDSGLKNLRVRTTGWTKDGVSQRYAGNIKLSDKLGEKNDFLKLTDFAEKNSIDFYVDIYIESVMKTNGKFNVNNHNIKNLYRSNAVRYFYDSMNRYQDFSKGCIYQITPSLFEKVSNEVIEICNKNEISGIALKDMGQILYSDYKVNKEFNRMNSKEKSEKALEILSGTVKTAISNPNMYALKYSDYIFDLPTQDSNFSICDEAVPFYQIVVRGKIPYSAPALNYEQDYSNALLRAVEFGSELHYVLSANNTALLKNSDYNDYITGYYPDWKEKIIEDYKKAANILKNVSGMEIIDHRKISDTIFETTYSNGISVLVNYGKIDAEIEGLLVPATGFIQIKKGEVL